MSTRNIVPRADGEGSLGTTLKNWLSGFFKWINIAQYIKVTPQDTFPTTEEGSIFYNNIEKTLLYFVDNGVHIPIGRLQVVKLKNDSGGTLTKGQLVYICGSNGINACVELAKADTLITSQVIGIVFQATIEDEETGYIALSGVIKNVDTSLVLAGNKLYLSDTEAGKFTNIKPIIVSTVGYCLFSHATEGRILISIQDVGEISGDMLKLIYDTDNNGIVDKAESIDDGSSGEIHKSTAIEVRNTVDKTHEHSNKSELDLVTDGNHDVRTDNPHSVTKTQVGLGNVDDKSEATIITDVKLDIDIADALTKRHTQNTDTKLDEGGLNEVSASDIVKKDDIKYYYAESLGESNTTSAYPTYINKLTFSIPSPIAGDYILELHCEVANSGAGGDTCVLMRNSTSTLSEARISCAVSYANRGWVKHSITKKVTLSSAETYYIDFCRQTNTAYIKNTVILLRRVI